MKLSIQIQTEFISELFTSTLTAGASIKVLVDTMSSETYV